MSEEKPKPYPFNVHRRLLAVIEDAKAIPKTGTAAREMGGYAFHQIDDVVEHLRPLLVKHGVLMLPRVVSSATVEVTVPLRDGGQRLERRASAEISVVYVNVDDPQDRTEPVSAFGDGIDSSDKAAGKAMSYAMKNHLLSMFWLRGHPDNEAAGWDDRSALASPPRKQTRPASPGYMQQGPPPGHPAAGRPAPEPEPASPERTQRLKTQQQEMKSEAPARKQKQSLSEEVAAALAEDSVRGSKKAWLLVAQEVAKAARSPNIKAQSGAQRRRLYRQLAADLGLDSSEEESIAIAQARESLRADYALATGGCDLDDAPWTVHSALYVLCGGAPESGK